ncbi:MAG: Hsp20/alpha crystallin family protein [Thaumarchaeota archaeon]|nr:Hsp20/alpha crystallin family protein [Nitrososphaerota archaeon]
MSEDKRRDLRDMLDELDRYFEEFEKDIQDSVRNSITAARSQADPFVAGFSFRMSPEGRPTMQFFGDNPSHRDGYRSPMSEQIVDEKAGILRLVFDMPGVEKEDIDIESTEDRVVVKAEKTNRKYKVEVDLKSKVDPDSGKAEYKNGVLEISFSLRDKANKGFTRVNLV